MRIRHLDLHMFGLYGYFEHMTRTDETRQDETKQSIERERETGKNTNNIHHKHSLGS